MKKSLSKILVSSFISLITITLTTSCNNPLVNNYSLVQQKEIETLLNSPNKIQFEGHRYMAEISFDETRYKSNRLR